MESDGRTRTVCFGAYRVDCRSGLLYKHGIRLKLQDQPFQVLELLLEHPGDLVTREELRQRLWPADTYVDFDTGLNNAVKKLRDVLSDSAEKPVYIETLPRRGYRFIARIQNGNGEVAAAAAVEPPAARAGRARRPRKRWYQRHSTMAIAAAIVVLVTAAATWRFFFTRPVLAKTDVILLTNFINKTGDPLFDGSLDKALEVKLTESPFLRIFPEGGVRATMAMMRHDPSERVTRDLGIEVCNRQGLRAVVVPEIAVIGGKYLITLEAIDARSEQVFAQQQIEAVSKDQVIAALGMAGSQLRRQLGESLSSVEKHDAPLDFATTSSLEALQSFRAGLLQFRYGKHQEAIALLERAVAVDPQFSSAYRALGAVSNNQGDQEAARKYYAKAFALKDGRLTPEENFLTTGLYYMQATGNIDKAVAEFALYKEAYPRSTIAHNVLGVAYLHLGRAEEALQEFRWAVNNAPVPATTDASNETWALMYLDQIDEAKKLLDVWRQKRAMNPAQTARRYRIAFFENDSATMEQLARQAPADDNIWLALQMELAFFRGDTGKLRSASEILVSRQERAQRRENAANEFAWHAQLESYLGFRGAARKLCHQAKESSRDSNVALGRCAKALAEAGDVGQAEAMAAKLDRLRPEDTLDHKVHLPIIRSIIEVQRGNGPKAVELLAPVAQYERGQSQVLYHRAQAYLSAGEHARAAAEFEKLIAHRGWADWAVFAPLSQLGLARALALQGNRETSRKAYDDFFATWKNADPEIPIFSQAKAESRKLAANSSNAAPEPANRRQVRLARTPQSRARASRRA